jgi:hypothetical protein
MTALRTLAACACIALATAWSAQAANANRQLEARADIEAAAATIRMQAGDRRLLLIGEKHGTREAPALVARLATAYSAEGPLVLALEIHRSMQPGIDAYLASPGDAPARAALVADAFWKVADDQHDGRRSMETLDLIEHVRALRAAGRDVAILAFDPGSGATDHHARDRMMAAWLRNTFAALPRGRILVLTGNVHAMLERPGDAPPQMQRPMGSWLRDLEPFSVDMTAADGAFWACPRPAPCGSMRERTPLHAAGAVHGSFHWRVVLDRFTVGRLLGKGADRASGRDRIPH